MGQYGKKQLGDQGEQAAARFLEKAGFKILHRNYRTRLGEIDLIADDEGTTVFVEVKTRRSLAFGSPQEAVHPRKRRQITRVALNYIRQRGLEGGSFRFDVVSVFVNDRLQPAHIEIIRDAFPAQY